MNFDNYKIIPNYNTNKTDLFTADEEDILACEKTLNITFDEDYKEYVQNMEAVFLEVLMYGFIFLKLLF